MKKEPAGLKSTKNQSPSLATGNDRNYKSNNKKQLNKNICPFVCLNCQSLGGDLVESKYEIINILFETRDGIYTPNSSEVEKRGQIYSYVDIIKQLGDQIKSIQRGQALLRKDLVKAGVIKAE